MKKTRSNTYYFVLVIGLVMSTVCMRTNLEAADTLKIGVVAELTGPAATWGLSILHGVQWAVADAGSELTVGGAKFKLEIVAYDGKYTGTDSVAALNRLLFQDKVKFIIGPIGSAPCMAMKEIVTKNKLVQMCNSFTERLLDPSTKNIFRVLTTPGEYSRYMAKWINDWHEKNMQGKPKTYAFIAPNDESGWAGVKYASAGLEAFGFKVVFKEFYERGGKDFVPLLTKMMPLNPTYIDGGGGSPGETALIVKQAYQIGFKGQATYFGGPGFEEIIRVAGKYSEGLIGWAPTNVDEPKIKALAERHTKEFDRPMNLLFPNFYNAAQMLFAALQESGAVDDPDKAIKAIETLRFTGVLGPIKWVGKERYGIDHQILHNMYVGRIIGETYKIVGTLNID